MFGRKNIGLYILPNDYIIRNGKIQHNLYRGFQKRGKKPEKVAAIRIQRMKKFPKARKKYGQNIQGGNVS